MVKEDRQREVLEGKKRRKSRDIKRAKPRGRGRNSRGEKKRR